MSSYENFARVYDLFMDNIPYEEWCGYLTGLLQEYGVTEGLVLELGCGTGNMTRLLANRGYDMIGVDNAPDMLEIAMEKRQEELLQVFRLVNNYLDPGGVFIFDLNTAYKYREVLGEQTIAENREDASFIWDNYYDPDEQINEYDLALFIPETIQGETLYRKYEETHYQRAYEIENVKEMLEQAGMEFVAVYDAFTHEAPKPGSERVYFIAREKGKQLENKDKKEI